MDKNLWDSILAFDLDNPPSEYGFSIRLASENFWTMSFTEQAIEEYKKFMYLAATSEFMVSPSEIVDKVWHQHLIFTQSYQAFCGILGRQIQHVPSTHNKEDFGKFRQAKERTTRLYESAFGKQPPNIWLYNDMFDILHLDKARIKIRSFIIFGLLTWILLSVPAYFLLRPLYGLIDNPYFIIGLIPLSLIIFIVLEYYNKFKLRGIVSGFDKTSFIYNLTPLELVYLNTQKTSSVVNGVVGELVGSGTISINEDNSLSLVKQGAATNIMQLQATAALAESGTTFYPNLLRLLSEKPVFSNIPNSMDAFRKYFNKSKKFGALFYTNFYVLSLLLLLSFTRIVTGVLKDVPVAQVAFTTVVLAIVAVVFLHRLTMQVSTSIIPDLYRYNILPNGEVGNSLQWSYFLLGSSALTASFLPLVNEVEKNSDSGVSSCVSSCGSSCSSCGSCGGD